MMSVANMHIAHTHTDNVAHSYLHILFYIIYIYILVSHAAFKIVSGLLFYSPIIYLYTLILLSFNSLCFIMLGNVLPYCAYDNKL